MHFLQGVRMATYVKFVVVSAIVVTSAYGQVTKPSSSTAAPSAKSSARLSNVTWENGFDKFNGLSVVSLTLRNIALRDSSYAMVISTFWPSDLPREAPALSENRNTVVLFSSSAEPQAHFARKGILLLNGNQRIFLTGSSTCQSVGCVLPPKGLMFSWVVAELGSSTMVEGMVDDTEFSLKPEQIAALKEYVNSRELIRNDGDQLKNVGLTAQEAAKQLKSELIAEGPGRWKHRNDVNNVKIDYLSTTNFSLTFDRTLPDFGDNDPKFSATATVDTKALRPPSDMNYGCVGDDSKDVSIEIDTGRRRGEKSASDCWNGFFSLLEPAQATKLMYIWYRIMFHDDVVALSGLGN